MTQKAEMADGRSDNLEHSIAKPIRQAMLIRKVAEILEGIDAAPASAATTNRAAAEGGASASFKILIAEDNPVNRKLLQTQLGKLGYAADVVINGADAIEALARIPYDLIFMDCQMPKMDGYEATRLIRGSGNHDGRPWIVAMTANAMQGDREKCIEAGMNEYVTKPVDLGAVRAVIERRLAARLSA
jgi:CheY-like chemotaxis protein